MAIIIPSRSIYKIQNPKVRDNLVDKVEVAVTEVTPNNEYETPVYNEAILEVSNKEGTPKNYQELVTEKMGSGNNTAYRLKFRHLDLNYAFLSNYLFQIPRIKNNSYIDKVIVGLNKEDEENIKHTVYYDYEEVNLEGTLTYTISKDSGGNVSEDVVSLTFNEVANSATKSQSSGKIPKEYTHTFEYDFGAGTNVTKTLGIDDESNLDKEDIYTSTEQYFNFNISLLTQSNFDILQYYTVLSNIPTSLTTKTATVSGKRIKYIPKQVEITIYGDTIGIDLNDKTITIGDGNKPLSFDGNELMQTTNALNTAINGETEAVKGFYTSTLNAFINGKETATIRCSIGEYKDQDGNVRISPNGNERIFKVGDEVIPMVYTNFGDKAMSNYKDGSDKIFKVLATDIHAQGVAWQDLTLQEK